MQAVPSTYHQCIKFPFNGIEIVVPSDNSMSINTLSATETLVPHNHSSHEPTPSFIDCEQNLKMMSLGMGEYTLDSISALPVSPRSYGKPSTTKKPFSSAMILFGTFMQSSVPLEAEKEEQAIKDQIYREEEDVEVIVTTPISPKRYGKGYKFLTKMAYQGHGSLIGHKNALVEPLSHTQDRDTRDIVGLGFRLDNDIPTCD